MLGYVHLIDYQFIIYSTLGKPRSFKISWRAVQFRRWVSVRDMQCQKTLFHLKPTKWKIY
jgi:hypothetical protein